MASPEPRARPAEHLVHGINGPVVIIDGAVCALLNRLLGLDKIRAQVRGKDAQLDQTLLAIRLAGVATESSAPGTGIAAQPEPGPRLQGQLNETFSTSTAATILNMTDRGVRKAITEKRLKATLLDGRHRITREDLSAFMADR
jgi:excisionase family DNA binding protein